ncbi:MAG: ABC transporter permease [Candidatus Neomarinimicrobiota bacterium]
MTDKVNGEKNKSRLTKISFLLALFLIWEFVPVWTNSAKIIPPFHKVMVAFWTNLWHGDLLQHVAYSLQLIFTGILIGMILAFVLTALCIVSKRFNDIMDVVISIMHPLPGIALLPVVMLIVGLGAKSIIIIIVHSILWPLIVNALAGFNSIPKIQIELGKNLGMKGVKLIWLVMIPNAFPYILSGIKISWARSWRALVSAEMVFGASGMVGGLGWYIYKTRFFMDVSGMFAGLISVIIIGMLVDEFVLKSIEKNTVKKWGMSV